MLKAGVKDSYTSKSVPYFDKFHYLCSIINIKNNFKWVEFLLLVQAV